MLSLSLLRPWGMAIMYYGKDIENRTWEPHTLKPGDRFAIHNAKAVDARGVARVTAILQGRYPSLDVEKLCGPPGAIIGTVRFCGVVRGGSSTWFEGPVGWVLADPRPLREPITCLGQQRLWVVPEGIAGLLA
jgi:hypothetical protein